MKKLDVRLALGPDDERRVGQLAESGRRIVFEYAPEFLRDPLWLSPFKLPPEPGLIEHRELDFGPLFGLFDDSLPDGWGLLLMDRYFAGRGTRQRCRGARLRSHGARRGHHPAADTPL